MKKNSFLLVSFWYLLLYLRRFSPTWQLRMKAVRLIISIPLVGFPILLASLILLAFASQEKSSRMHKLNASMRLATLAFSFIRSPLLRLYSLIGSWLSIGIILVTIVMRFVNNTHGSIALEFLGMWRS